MLKQVAKTRRTKAQFNFRNLSSVLIGNKTEKEAAQKKATDLNPSWGKYKNLAQSSDWIA